MCAFCAFITSQTDECLKQPFNEVCLRDFKHFKQSVSVCLCLSRLWLIGQSALMLVYFNHGTW